MFNEKFDSNGTILLNKICILKIWCDSITLNLV